LPVTQWYADEIAGFLATHVSLLRDAYVNCFDTGDVSADCVSEHILGQALQGHSGRMSASTKIGAVELIVERRPAWLTGCGQRRRGALSVPDWRAPFAQRSPLPL